MEFRRIVIRKLFVTLKNIVRYFNTQLLKIILEHYLLEFQNIRFS